MCLIAFTERAGEEAVFIRCRACHQSVCILLASESVVCETHGKHLCIFAWHAIRAIAAKTRSANTDSVQLSWLAAHKRRSQHSSVPQRRLSLGGALAVRYSTVAIIVVFRKSVLLTDERRASTQARSSIYDHHLVCKRADDLKAIAMSVALEREHAIHLRLIKSKGFCDLSEFGTSEVLRR